MPKVSVIVPVYKAEATIRRCLDSLLAQSIGDLEVICVDDCSPDSSAEIIEKEYVEQGKAVKLLRNKVNRGPAGSRNVALTIAKGEFVGYMDADDTAESDFYERLYVAAVDDAADMAMGCLRYISNSATVCEKLKKETAEGREAKLACLPNGAMTNKIVRRELLSEHGLAFPEDIYFEDNEMLIRAAERANKIVLVPECYYNYFLGKQSRSLNENFKVARKDDALKMARRLSERARKHRYSDAEKQALADFIVRSFLGSNAYEHPSAKTEIKRLWEDDAPMRTLLLKSFRHYKKKRLRQKLLKKLIKVCSLFVPLKSWRKKLRQIYH